MGRGRSVVPRATYRVQLHAGFGFWDAASVASYWADLGVSHLYCSPYLQAAPGSTHGYDVVDPDRLSDDLGGTAGHAELTGALRAHGLAQVLDIVPNHMAVDPGNHWWWDVLENGPASRFAPFFDVDWETGGEKAAFTVLVPVLGDHYGRVLEAGEFTVRRQGGTLLLHYGEHRFPVSPRTLDEVLAAAARRAGSAELAELADRFGVLPHARFTDAAAVAERDELKRALADALRHICDGNAAIAAAVEDELGALNEDFDRLDELIRRQNYRLAYWRSASEELDYRRFFNIESLVGVRVEDPDVMAATHRLVLSLVRDGTIEGLRIDHVDGLRDPEGYLVRLDERTGGVYTVVEKILEPSESLPDSWPIAGTSGYDFLNRVNNLFVATGNAEAMTACYDEFTGESANYEEVVQRAKHQIMSEELASEVERQTGLLADICEHHRRHRDFTRRELRTTLREFVARFPVYRTYVAQSRPATDADRRHVGLAVDDAIEHRPDLDAELLRFIGGLALGEIDSDHTAEFTQRLQQLTAPVMAKGVEDTAFYRYHRLVSLNEVGGNPGVFGRPISDFHADSATMAARWPHSMLTLSTHDTKRSADVRARLNVLSEIPRSWGDAAQRWAEGNSSHRPDAVDRNTEYLLYQTLVGAWPIDAERLVAFMAKATKEAKVHTSWTDPDSTYDGALESFARAVLAHDDFLHDLERFLADDRIIERGRRNSLVQTALLLTCPGVPDVYQGSEVWDLSLVDPDNRRPVDYEQRRRLLDGVRGARPEEVHACADCGAPKLWLIHRLLQHRRARPELYDGATYQPMEAHGVRADDVIAFELGALAVVAPRLGLDDWPDTTVTVPAGSWSNVLTGAAVGSGTQPVAPLFAGFPVAVLERDGR
jgi:(1->4)-alpha-D-glucan 1-alpha-D-glucosylmutase